MNQRTRRRCVIAALTATTTVVLAACGSSGGAGDKTTGGSTGSAASSAVDSATATAGAPSSSGGGAATGTPIKFMTITVENTDALNYASLRPGVQAAVKEINAAGGVNGHPLQPVFCNEKRDPNEAVSCGRLAQAKDIVAVVGSAAPDMDQVLPLLESSGTADFGGVGANLAEYKSPVGFMTGGSGLAVQLGIAKQYVASGAKKLNVMNIDAPTAVPAVIENAVKSCGVSIGTTVKVPFSAPDVSSQVSQVLSNSPDGVIAVLDTGSLTALIRGISTSGKKPTLAVIDTTLPPSNVSQLGSTANGVLRVGQYPPASATNIPAVAAFVKAMGSSESTNEPPAIIGYASVQLFAAVAKTLPTVDKAAFLSGLKKGVGPVDTPLVKGFTTKKAAIDDPAFGKDYNSQTWVSTAKDGKIVLKQNTAVDAAKTC